MKSNSGPRIYMKNSPSQQSFKDTTHNAVYKSNINYFIKEAIEQEFYLCQSCHNYNHKHTHTPPGLAEGQH